MGLLTSASGTLKDGVPSVDGLAAGMWLWPTAFIQLPVGVEPDPDALVNYDAVAGRFGYHLVAVEEVASVQESSMVLLILGGLGAMTAGARRRKAGVS
ncbi:hypothetical protein [Thiobacillus denitrificans]|uniref:hypothetical protein n=1 Tax=Thiobacillus denitrificans TaxID=36861 RepID=UPI0011D08C18|nr:hypothetical protein [Thiobacillus denitrificans]